MSILEQRSWWAVPTLRAHIASAERGRADVFLSTDDRLIKRAKRNIQLIQIVVDNPVPWLMQSTQLEENNNA